MFHVFENDFLLLFYMYACMHTIWMQNPWNLEKNVASPGLGVTDECQPPCGCWECCWKSKSGSLQSLQFYDNSQECTCVNALDDIVSVDFTVCQLYLKSLVIKYHYKTQQKLKKIKNEGGDVYLKLQIAIDKPFRHISIRE